MELNLGLALSSSSSSSASNSSSSRPFDRDANCKTNYSTHDEDSMIPFHHYSKKRKHTGDGDDGCIIIPPTLPLLVWNNFCQSNDEQQDHLGVEDEVQSNSIFVNHRVDVGVVMGWPPVKLCRRKVCRIIGDDGDGSKSTYVKVHMEGVGIARKVDLNQHQSYQTLVNTLANMFGKCYEDVKLTYQDKEGDWLLAGDVPWGSFMDTVQRLRLLKK